MQEQHLVCTSWGHATSGKLGYQSSVNLQSQAVQVSTNDKKMTILDIACGEGHTLVL